MIGEGHVSSVAEERPGGQQTSQPVPEWRTRVRGTGWPEKVRHTVCPSGELLDSARIDAGVLPVSPEPSDAAVLVDRAVGLFQSGGVRSNVRVDLPADLPRVLGDRRRVEQVLTNLLTNAARHSPESSVIRVSAAMEGVHVAISVADDGVGVHPERLPYLFRRFFRAEGDKGDGVGAGLGLAVCKLDFAHFRKFSGLVE